MKIDITKLKTGLFAFCFSLSFGCSNVAASITTLSNESGIAMVPVEINQLQQQIEDELGSMESLSIIGFSEQLNEKGLSPAQLIKMKDQLAPEMDKIKRSAERIQRWNLLVNAHWKQYESSAAYQTAIEANKQMNFVLDNTIAIYLKIGDLTQGLIDIYDADTGITQDQYDKVSKAVGIFELEQRLSL